MKSIFQGLGFFWRGTLCEDCQLEDWWTFASSPALPASQSVTSYDDDMMIICKLYDDEVSSLTIYQTGSNKSFCWPNKMFPLQYFPWKEHKFLHSFFYVETVCNILKET